MEDEDLKLILNYLTLILKYGLPILISEKRLFTWSAMFTIDKNNIKKTIKSM